QFPSSRQNIWNERALNCSALEDISLQQSQMVRVFRLQSSDQKLELWKASQTRKARIFQEERPAGEPRVDALFKPLEGSFGLSRQGERASDLMICMVCVSEGFRTRTSFGHTSDCCFSVPHQGMEQTL